MSSNLSQNMLVSFQFVVRPGFHGYSLFQQIENHLADSADLISVGVSTCHDVCSNWIPSKHSVGRGVVVVTLHCLRLQRRVLVAAFIPLSRHPPF